MDPVSRAQNSAPQRKIGRPFERGNPHAFPKGVSGNPGGKPKNSISSIYRKWLNKSVNRKKIDAMLTETIEKGKMAGVLMVREMTERDEGKVADIVDMNVSGSITLEQVLEARKKAGKS